MELLIEQIEISFMLAPSSWVAACTVIVMSIMVVWRKKEIASKVLRCEIMDLEYCLPEGLPFGVLAHSPGVVIGPGHPGILLAGALPSFEGLNSLPFVAGVQLSHPIH